MTGTRMAIAAIVLAAIGVGAPTHAQEHGERGEHLHSILEGLEYGMVALEKLHNEEALHILRRIAEEVRQEIEGDRGERANPLPHRKGNWHRTEPAISADER